VVRPEPYALRCLDLIKCGYLKDKRKGVAGTYVQAPATQEFQCSGNLIRPRFQYSVTVDAMTLAAIRMAILT
jgi:hypothetical protein